MKKELFIISQYMEINGILNINKLKELLEKTNIKITKKEILNYCKEEQYIIKKELIYLNDLAIKLDEEEDLYEQKEENTYRECTYKELEQISYEKDKLDYIGKIKSIIKPKVKDKDKLNILATKIYYNVVSGCDYMCNNMELLDEENITLSERQETQLDNLVDEIYYCVPSWELNGYIRIDLADNEEPQLSFEELPESEKADIYVNVYLSLNGVIEINKLISILEQHHNIKLTNKEIRRIIKETDDLVITDKYIHVINLSIDDIEDIMIEKRKVNNYKIIDDINAITNELLDMISNLCFICLEYNLNEEILETLKAFIITGELNEEIIKNIIKIEKVDINPKKKNSLIEKLIEIQKESRLWTLNGYKITELNNEK